MVTALFGPIVLGVLHGLTGVDVAVAVAVAAGVGVTVGVTVAVAVAVAVAVGVGVGVLNSANAPSVFTAGVASNVV